MFLSLSRLLCISAVGSGVTVSGIRLDSIYEPYMTITATASDVDDLEFKAATVSRTLEDTLLYEAVTPQVFFGCCDYKQNS